MHVSKWFKRLEQAVVQHLTIFFAMMGDGEAPEFWHEREDLKPIPIPVRRDQQYPRR